MPWIVLMSACGTDRVDFIDAYTESYCTWMLRCVDPAILTFDGIDSVESCGLVYTAEVAAVGTGCKYKARYADDCADETRNASCPVDGRDFPVTPSCIEVYADCASDFPESSFDTGAVVAPQ
jgi:hypothetical protein